MTTLLPEQIAVMVEKRAPRRSLLIRIAHNDGSVSRFWTGHGPLPLDAADTLDPGATFAGSGVMQDLPPFREMTAGTMQRVEFAFFARHPRVRAMMAAGVDMADINLAYVFFNEDWSLAGPAAWLWQGVIDSPSMKRDGLTDLRMLSAYTGVPNRKRAGRCYWSNAGHQSRHAGDLMCAFMNLMSLNAQEKWV